MRRWWLYFFILLICLPAAYPYLGGDIPRSNDSLTHLFRAVELDRLVRSGALFPRWAPDFAHGYGYPIFNYFAYLSHYLIVLFHVAGLPFLSALRASYVTALLASGLTAFLLARDLADGDSAGLAAAVAYVYSPYLLYTAHVRGGLPESLALAFFPLALWAVRRALIPHEGTKARSDTKATNSLVSVLSASLRCNRYTVIAALAIAGFIASHIGMAIQYLPLLGVFGGYVLTAERLKSGDSKNVRDWLLGFWNLGFGFLLGLGLTAFLWLPTLADLQYVQFQAAFARAGLVYRENLLSLHELFAYPRVPVHIDVLNPPLARSLSFPAIGLAVLGLIRLRATTAVARANYLFVFALFAVTTLLVLDVSKPIWDVIGLLQRSTFPWRFLGPASLFAAVLAGAAISKWRLVIGDWKLDVEHLSLFIVSILIASSLPFLLPPREPAPENPTRADLARFEIPPLLVGTTTTGEYTPIWVKEFPDTRAMQDELLAGRDPERLDAPGATVEHLSARPAHDTYRITSPQPITATYRSFYFPGWAATLDGQPIKISITDPNGLMSFDVPAGAHMLEIRFGSTPVRTAAGWISIVSLVVVIGLLIISHRRLEIRRFAWTLHAAAGSLPFGIWNLGFGIFGIVSLLILSLFIRRPGPPPTQQPLNLDFGGELTLIGYDTRRGHSSFRVPRSEITLVWQAQHPIGVPYGMNVRLTDDRGLIWSDTNIERPRDWRFIPGTDFWPPDKFILDSYVLKSLRGTPPGSYHLEAIVYRADTLQALSVQSIGEYVVEVPTKEPIANPILTLDGIALIAAEADRAAAAPGDPYRLTLRWQAVTDSPPDRDTHLELVDPQGNVVYTRAEPIVPQFSPSKWKRGDVLTQYAFFRLPASLPGGGFHWRIGGAELPATAAVELSVTAPTRLFEPPALAHPLTVDVGSSVSLLGYNAKTEGNTIAIDLVWQAKSEMNESYRVFLHLLDADSNLVSQSDGEPANWSRPTSGWLRDEVVVDTRTLTAPGPGEYTLSAGMVSEAGGRLSEPILLGTITLAP